VGGGRSCEPAVVLVLEREKKRARAASVRRGGVFLIRGDGDGRVRLRVLLRGGKSIRRRRPGAGRRGGYRLIASPMTVLVSEGPSWKRAAWPSQTGGDCRVWRSLQNASQFIRRNGPCRAYSGGRRTHRSRKSSVLSVAVVMTSVNDD